MKKGASEDMALSYYRSGEPMWACGVCDKHLDYAIEKSFDYCKEHAEQGAKIEANKREKEYRRQLKRLSEITSNSCIVCPHCFYENELWYEYLDGDGESTEIECEDCGKDFKVTLSISYALTSEKVDDRGGE